VSGAVTRALAIDPAERFGDCRSFARAILVGRADLLAMVGGQRPSTPLALPRQLPDAGRPVQPTILPPVSEGPGPDAPTLREGPGAEPSAYTIQVGDESPNEPVVHSSRRAVTIMLVLTMAVAGGLAFGWAGSRVLAGGLKMPTFGETAAKDKALVPHRPDSGGPGPGGRARKGKPVSPDDPLEGARGALPASGRGPVELTPRWSGHAGARKITLRVDENEPQNLRVTATGFLREAEELEGVVLADGRLELASDRIELKGSVLGGRLIGAWRKSGQDNWYGWEASAR
jgi:hypothetical protein